MSSAATRTKIKDYFAANSAETLIDISLENRELTQMLNDYGVGQFDNWVAIQFVGSDEEPISIEAKCYREFGAVFFHVVAPIQNDVLYSNILPRVEVLRSVFRGQRIDDIIIESVSPINTEDGTTIDFDNGFTSGTFFINYYRDIKGA